MGKRDLLIAECEKYVGYLEKKTDYKLESLTENAGYNNYTIFAKKYANYGFGAYNVYQAQPWCAMAVTDLFYDALGYTLASKIITPYAYCPYGVQHWKTRGRWHSRKGYTPQIGDVIFFQSGGVSCHTGIVRGVDKSYVYTYEGNTSSASGVEPNGGGFFKKSYELSNTRIMGYGNPDWNLIEDNDFVLAAKALKEKGYITDLDTWTDSYAYLRKDLACALVDKITGGTWKSDEADRYPNIWSAKNVFSLAGKNGGDPDGTKVIGNTSIWLEYPSAWISNGLFLALVDKSTGGTLAKYKNKKTDHWGRNHLDSLCDKGFITGDTLKVWNKSFEGTVLVGDAIILICKAFGIKY